MSGIPDQGFEILPGVFDRSDLSPVVRALEETAIPNHRAGRRNILRTDEVRALAHDCRLMQLARSGLGESAFPFRATLFRKSRQQNWLVVWHQGTALPLSQRLEVAGWGPWSIKAGVVCAHAPAYA